MGTGSEISIQNLVRLLIQTIGYQGKIEYNNSMPNGMPCKVMDISRINKLGWKHKIDLEEGLAMTCTSFAETRANKSVTEDSTFESQAI